jgi:hypothetical protein
MEHEIASRTEAETDPAKKAEQERLREEYYAANTDDNEETASTGIIRVEGANYRICANGPNNAAG